MKQLFEIKQTIDLLKQGRNVFAPVEVQALEWAFKKIELEGRREGENLILNRIAQLQIKQVSKEVMGFATKPARAKQINALRWVINEMEIDHFEPAY